MAKWRAPVPVFGLTIPEELADRTLPVWADRDAVTRLRYRCGLPTETVPRRDRHAAFDAFASDWCQSRGVGIGPNLAHNCRQAWALGIDSRNGERLAYQDAVAAMARQDYQVGAGT